MLGSLFEAAFRHVPTLFLATIILLLLTRSVPSWLPFPSPPEPWKLDYVSVVKARKTLISLGLPMELALQILNHAEYWPAHSFSTPRGKTTRVAATMLRPSAAGLCLDIDIFDDITVIRALHRPGETLRLKALTFCLRSRDQGWTSEPTRGTFSTSSWLEVSILRGVHSPDAALPPSCYLDSVFASPREFNTHVAPYGWYLVPRPEEAEQGPQGGEGALAWYLQGNRVATQGRVEEYAVRWVGERCEADSEGAGSGTGLLEALREGDRVLVWARAKVSFCICFFECERSGAIWLADNW